jgi:putative MATE family efflux protein
MSRSIIMKITKDLTVGNIYKNFLLYATPLLLSSLLSQMYSTIDGMIAGKFISEHALGAISSTGSFVTLSRSFFRGFAAGFSIYIAKLFGQKDYRSLKKDVIHVSVIVALVSVLISIISIIFHDPIIDYLQVDPVLRKDAETYFVIYTAGYVIYFLNLVLVRVLYALGVTSFSLYISFISAFLNIGGNLLSVLVLDLGVAGLAISTVLSSATSTAIYILLLRKAYKELPQENISYKFSFDGIRNSLSFTIPAAIQQLSFHGISFIISPSINGLGADASTGYNVSIRLYDICAQSLWSATEPITCYVAQCSGKGDTGKIKRGLRVGFLLNIIMMLPFILGMVIFAKPVISLFFPTGYEGLAFQYVLRYARFYLAFLYVQMIGHILHSYMRSLGSVNVVLGITLVGSIVRVVATLWLVTLIGMDGVFIGQIISWAADAVISTVIYLLYFRTHEQIIKRLAEKKKKKEQQKKQVA